MLGGLANVLSYATITGTIEWFPWRMQSLRRQSEPWSQDCAHGSWAFCVTSLRGAIGKEALLNVRVPFTS